MSEGIRRRSLPTPPPLGARGESLEARVRLKLDRGDPLDPEEAAFLARFPAQKEIPPEEIRASARAHGGETPIDAATGRAHDPDAKTPQDRSSARNPPRGTPERGPGTGDA